MDHTFERWPRIILHADMDAFFAAIEQLDDPSLRGKPLLIGYPGARGVVATASYEARPFGVGSAMPMEKARRLCPQAIVRPPRFERYQALSRVVMETFEAFSPKVEALSLDEAFLDMSGSERLLGPPVKMGRALKAAVFEATGGLRVSVGIAPNKYVAKVASDHQKPDGLTLVPPSEITRFLAPLPLSRLWGVGPVTQQRLLALGLSSIGDLQGADSLRLEQALGASGAHFQALARGLDDRPVIRDHNAKSIGAEATLDRDVFGAEEIRPHLLHAADRIAARLRRAGLLAKGVRVKLKTRRFELLTRQRELKDGLDDADSLYSVALSLLQHFKLDQAMRLVGMAVYDLQGKHTPSQQDLFSAPKAARRNELNQVLDSIEDRFGRGAIKRASAASRTGSEPEGDEGPK